MVRKIRNKEIIGAVQDKQLLILSAVKPEMGFTAATAMMRNRYIYAQSEAAVVVRADYKKGGTWNGAVDCIKHNISPVFTWDNSEYKGNMELIKMGSTGIDEKWNGDIARCYKVADKEPVQLTLSDLLIQ